MKPVVSVCMITYNHEPYIAQAIEGILKQKTSFSVELIIGDDNSTDGTAEIIKKYASRYPQIRYHRRRKNLGMMENFVTTLRECTGKYIALCEGDDYWTSSLKLRKQVNFLETHPNYAICAHNVWIEKGGKRTKKWYDYRYRNDLRLGDLMRYGSGGATCSLLFRNKVFGDFPAWYSTIKGGDWTLQLLCANKGTMRCLPEVMGVYRRHSHGSLSVQKKQELKWGNTDLVGLSYKYSLSAYAIVDRAFGYQFSAELNHQRCFAYGQLALEYLFIDDVVTAQRYAKKHFHFLTAMQCGLTFIQHLVLLSCLLPLWLQRKFWAWRRGK